MLWGNNLRPHLNSLISLYNFFFNFKCCVWVSSFVFYIYFCSFWGDYTETLKIHSNIKEVWGRRKEDKYTFKCEIYFVSFNNENLSWSRLIGYPIVLRCCGSQELLHPEKDVTCYLAISYLSSSSTSVWLFNNNFLCYYIDVYVCRYMIDRKIDRWIDR